MGLVASATSIEGLKGQVANLALSAGSKGRLEFDGFGLGIAADFPGAEAVWRSKLTPLGIVVDDVHGEGHGTAVVEFHVSSLTALQGQASMSLVPALLVVLGAVTLALVALGWLIKQVRLFLDGDGGVGGIGLLLLVGLGLLVAFTLSKRGRI